MSKTTKRRVTPQMRGMIVETSRLRRALDEYQDWCDESGFELTITPPPIAPDVTAKALARETVALRVELKRVAVLLEHAGKLEAAAGSVAPLTHRLASYAASDAVTFGDYDRIVEAAS